MRLITVPASRNDERFTYIRCVNEGADCYTNVVLTDNEAKLDWLADQYDECVVRDGTLPGYRLYMIVED